MDAIAPEALLGAYPDEIAAVADRLRRIVVRAQPDALERVRTGWRLIGYDLSLGGRRRYFAFIAPEPEHVHLGFEYGAWMTDPDGVLRGAHLGLRKVRFTTFQPADAIPEAQLDMLVREAARVAAMPDSERLARALDRSWEPSRDP
jgi:hypothetical protein